MEASQENVCTFCGRNRYQVKILIGGDNTSYICDNCVQKCHDLISGKLYHTDNQEECDNSQEELDKVEPVIPSPSTIKDALDQYVVGQDEAKTIIAVAAYNHYKRINNPSPEGVELDRSNCLMIGPSGSGKTLIAQSLARFLDVPWAMADATSLTEAGYVGEDVESIIGRLLANADYDIEKAQRGIVFIDEIDKKKSAKSAAGGRDISGEGVQQALLKILEGSDIMVSPPGRRNADRVKVNTRNILFIVSGAFVGIEKIISEERKQIGFGANQPLEIKGTTMSEHLIKFGLIPEMVGRLPVVAILKELNVDQLLHVLTEPRNAITKQFRAMFRLDNINLEFTDDALLALATQSVANRTGARGLRSIIEQSLMKTQFKLPEMRDNGVETVIITEKVFTQGLEPEVKFRKL